MTALSSRLDRPLQFGIRFRRLRQSIRKRATFIWGIVDQGALSLSSLLLTLVLANALDVRSFGRFSIAWAFSILLEAVFFRGLFDDGLPAVAHRLAKSQWPQFRASVYLISMISASVVGALLMVLGAIAVGFGSLDGWLLIATGAAIPANRAQSVFRRMAYLDGRLLRVVIGALIYALVLAASVVAMIAAHWTSAAMAMACVAVAATSAGTFGLLHRADVARPSWRVLIWAGWRLFRAGRWFVATSLSYWISSIGLIPLCGVLIGLEASASLRLMLVVFAPLSQLNASMLSVKLPEAAQTLRSGDTGLMQTAVRANALLFGGISAAYGLAAVLIGIPLLSLLTNVQSFQLTEGNLLLFAAAMAMDGVWLGLALPLFAIGQPQRFFVSRMTGLASLGIGLFVFAAAWGLTGVIGAMALSSTASVAVLWCQLMSRGASSKWERQ